MFPDSRLVNSLCPVAREVAGARCLLHLLAFNSERPGSLARPSHFILQCGGNIDRQSFTMIVVPNEMLLHTEQGDLGVFSYSNCLQLERSAWPLQTDRVERSTILAASESNRGIFAGWWERLAMLARRFGKGNLCALHPQITRTRTSLKYRFAIQLQPLANLVQLIQCRWTESAVAIRTNPDHKTATFCYGVSQILYNPTTALVMIIGPAIGKAASQWINHKPGHICRSLAPWHISLRRVVVTVIPDAAGAKHYVRLDLTKGEHCLSQLRPHLFAEPHVDTDH